MADTSDFTKRTIYIPQMSFVAAEIMSAAFRSVGIQAEPSPDSDQRTLELAAKFTSGDECYPEIITLGNMLKIIERPDFDPKQTGFLMPTSGGPCRFGQYRALLKKVLKDLGLNEIVIISPTSSDGYEGFGAHARDLIRIGWWAVVVSDLLRKMQLKIRPYETSAGDTDCVFAESLAQVSAVFGEEKVSLATKRKKIIQTLLEVRERFHRIPARYQKDEKLLIGIVGEIFCRLDDFSNNFLIRKIEAQGGEVWISDIAEWVWYTNDEQRLRIIRRGQRFSFEMAIARFKFWVQHQDEKKFWAPFRHDFRGYEEVPDVHEIMSLSEPYLPQNGALGEMVSSIGKSLYLYQKGADGVIDISPFSCMNGIVCETVFPIVSQHHDNFPIRTFYFDGTQTTVEQDVEIFMELARNYQQRKKHQRTYPAVFSI
jgi:predicted nucleotide-binding protein (sugar kinase/HSP70/actin superfamily)